MRWSQWVVGGVFLFFSADLFAVSRVKPELLSHIQVPFNQSLRIPRDLPLHMRFAGKFVHPDGKRREYPVQSEGISIISHPSAPRLTGVKFPIQGQWFQGISGMAWNSDGTVWMVSDNGFESRQRSVDVPLLIYRARLDWQSSEVRILEAHWLRDPNRVLPFGITNEGTKKRYLTGGDLDPESIIQVGNRIFIGDSYGPHLLELTKKGILKNVWDLKLGKKTLMSPDHYSLRLPSQPGVVRFDIKRGNGVEGLTLSPDRKKLWLALGVALYQNEKADLESYNGRPYVRILEFDLESLDFTGKSFRYGLVGGYTRLSDFQVVDAQNAVLIERDRGEGELSMACQGPFEPGCHNRPARYKRLIRVSLNPTPQGFFTTVSDLDLLSIQDPHGKSKIKKATELFSYPFSTIRSVLVTPQKQMILVNDNNYGMSSARTFGKPDLTEFVLLKAEAFWE